MKTRDDIVTQVRRYELITPLFGGGVQPGVNDVLTPITGKAVRGHLRFWWRATRGGQFQGTLEGMKRAEENIWGGASTKDSSSPSRVKLTVELLSHGKPETPFKDKGKPTDRWKILSYAAFPLGERDDLPSVRTSSESDRLSFNLVISFPDEIRQEVAAALWAWETFGGIGGRTRRGFGAFHLVDLSENGSSQSLGRPSVSNAVRSWVEAKMKEFGVTGSWHNDVPHLSSKPTTTWLKVTQAKPPEKQGRDRHRGSAEKKEPLTPIEVWEFLIGKLKEFRQARFDKKAFREGRGKIKNEYGISRWPEANEIRRRLGISRNIVDPTTPSKFPRAHFGLPINFHLPHDDDEPNVILQRRQEKLTRRASPLILRPITCLDGKSVGLALLLEPTLLPSGELRLEGEPTTDPIVPIDSTQLTLLEAMQIEPMNRQTNVLQAFLSTIQ
ncbi:MAG: type III-B CRISPR module RAMP protein Cmr1 [Pyrinomonadaceae bacterium]